MKIKYSILITVYNKEKYLRRCLDSVVNQTYNKAYEIIIVDDGSTDDSSKIIKEYMERCNNIIYYYKENTGVADTRNFAISKVNGDFFLFVDADDYVSTNLLEKLNFYINKKVDIVSFSSYRIDNQSKAYNQDLKDQFFEISGKEAVLIYNTNDNIYTFDVPWGYIYRTNFFKENHFEYLYGTEHEDVSLTPIIITKAKKVTSLKYKGYYYVQNSDSITHNLDTVQKRIIDKLNNLKILSLFYQEQNFNDIELEYLRLNVLYKMLNIVIENDIVHIPFFIQQIKELKIYEIIPNNSKTNKLYRWLFIKYPNFFIIFYFTYIYNNDYDNFPVYIQKFFTKMRLYGKEKYKKIIESTKKSYYIMRIRRAFLFWNNLIIHLPLLLPLLWDKNYIHLDYIELVITTKCNLKCKHCANLIPMYSKKASNVSYKDLNIQIKKLLKNIDRIDLFRVLGGEPFLHPDLDKILEKLIKSKKVKKIMVVTNSSIIPQNENLIKMLKNDKVSVNISNYPILEEKTKKLKKFLEKHNIRMEFYYSIKDNFWIDYGETVCQNKSTEELKKQFANCEPNKKCLSYFKGKLHQCPRSSHLTDLGFIKCTENEYVDLLDKNKSYKFKRQKITKLLSKTEYLTACNYCNIGTNKAKIIKPAEQIE